MHTTLVPLLWSFAALFSGAMHIIILPLFIHRRYAASWLLSQILVSVFHVGKLITVTLIDIPGTRGTNPCVSCDISSGSKICYLRFTYNPVLTNFYHKKSRLSESASLFKILFSLLYLAN